MATKQFLTLEGLSTYDGLIKQYIGTEDAKSIKSISVSGNTVSFFKTADGSGTAAYTVDLPDVSGFMDKIANATGGKIATTTSTGEVAESNTAISDLATQTDLEGLENSKLDKLEDPSGDRVIMSNSDGSISEGLTIASSDSSGIITGYFLDGAGSGDVMVYDGSGEIGTSGVSVYDLATQTDITELQDDIGDVETELNTLETLVGTIPPSYSATTVVDFAQEVAGIAADDAEVTLVEAQTPTTGYLKTYELYQGGNTAANLIGKIDIPKDLVVTSGEIVVNPTGQPAGTYLKLVIANQTEPVYINVADLCDVYTAAASAAQVQLAISSTNEISATLVAGGVGTTELATSAVTTQKIADDAVTADKVAITAHTEAQTAGADGVAISVTTTDGQVSAVSASIASNTYDAYGAASTVQSTVIGSAGDAASANTINGAKAYADAATAAIATADIEALFE